MIGNKINNNDLYTTYGVYVVKADGLLDLPKRKGNFQLSYPDSNGVTVFNGTNDTYFEGRDINVKCVAVANNYATFETNIRALRTMLETAGNKTLVFNRSSTAYTCTYLGGVPLNNDAEKVCGVVKYSFELKFLEQNPTV